MLWARCDIDVETGCWNFGGSKNSRGYGVTKIMTNGKQRYVHREMFRNFLGNLPDGYKQHVHHKCGNKSCCNPDHLESKSAKSHKMDHMAESRKFCPYGHELGWDNSYSQRTGFRQCPECIRGRALEYSRRPEIKARRREYMARYYQLRKTN